MTSGNSTAKAGDDIEYQTETGVTIGTAWCIVPAIHGTHDGYWQYIPTRLPLEKPAQQV